MEPNPFTTDNIRFVFDAATDIAELSYTAREDWDVCYAIGLDGVHRLTETNDSVFTAVGEWTSPTTFRVEVEIVGYSSFDSWEFTFEGDEIHVTEYSLTVEYSCAGKARYHTLPAAQTSSRTQRPRCWAVAPYIAGA